MTLVNRTNPKTIARGFVFTGVEVDASFICFEIRSAKSPRQQDFLKKSPVRLLGSPR